MIATILYIQGSISIIANYVFMRNNFQNISKMHKNYVHISICKNSPLFIYMNLKHACT